MVCREIHNSMQREQAEKQKSKSRT